MKTESLGFSGFSRRHFLLGGVLCAGTPILAFAQQAAFRATQGRYNSSLTLSLSGLRTTHAGDVIKSAQGSLRQGYQIEGVASATLNNGIVVTRPLKIIADIFSPAMSFPGQRKGFSYFNGHWALEPSTDPVASSQEDFKGRLAGRIKAELPADPAAGPAAINGSLDIPMTRLYEDANRTAFRPVRGSGSMVLSTNATGRMSLALSLWPLFESTTPNT